MSQIRVSLSYRREKKTTLETFATGVITNMVAHPTVFTNLPITQAMFQALITTYVLVYGIYKQGGLGQKTAFENAWAALVAGLDQLAVYVDEVADGDEGIIVQAGFVATKGTKSKKSKPEQGKGVKVQSLNSGLMTATCGPDPLATSYVCIVTEGAALPAGAHVTKSGQLIIPHTRLASGEDGAQTPTSRLGGYHSIIIDLTHKRKKEFTGLNVGSAYYFVFCPVNATGVGQLSAPVMKMCS